MKRKRGQMEIMGLTIVVILIILGVLFGIRVISKPQADIEKEFKMKSMSVNYLNTLLGTTSDCYKATFRELIQDCAQGAAIRCNLPDGGIGDSCLYTDDVFTKLLNNTLTKIKKRYHLHLEGPGAVADIEVTNPTDKPPCPGERTRGTQYIPSRRGTVNIILDIC